MNFFRNSASIVAVLSATCVLAQNPSAPSPSPNQASPQAQPSAAKDRPRDDEQLTGLYSGNWVTTNRKLDGTMKCEIKDLGKDQWQGRFWGIWQGVSFDYTVKFETQKSDLTKANQSPTASEGPESDTEAIQVSGKAMIDGAHYDWTGTLTPEQFDIKFSGSRYNGYAELTRVKARPQPPRKLAENIPSRK